MVVDNDAGGITTYTVTGAQFTPGRQALRRVPATRGSKATSISPSYSISSMKLALFSRTRAMHGVFGRLESRKPRDKAKVENAF